jgi:tetratricopeptide (TPR) repeat protein
LNAERWSRIQALFDRIVDVPVTDRRHVLEEETGGDQGLIDEVIALASAHESSHPLLDRWDAGSLQSGMRLGPWAIDRLLGAGGMGSVYLAHRADGEFDKAVAVKLLSHGLSTVVHQDRFRRERRVLALLEHPNIARLIDSGVNECGQPYLVMEYVEGVPLDEWRRSTQPSLEEILAVWFKIAAAVSYAHRNLVVHRDLKPSNILVESSGEPKLLDFGIAKLLADESNANETTYLTPRYASPEQIAGANVSTATDIYSLGVLLKELAPSEPPKDLAAILGMALRPEPERRYASVDQFADDVRRYQMRLPVMARPENWRYRAAKFVQRHKAVVAFGINAALALLLVTGIAVWQTRRADRQRVRAERVSEFLASIMGATPDGSSASLRGRGVSLRVVDLVNSVAERVDREMSDDGEAEATLRYVIGSTYWEMGLLEQAARNAGRSTELGERLYEPDDPRLLKPRLLRAQIKVQRGEFAEGEREFLDIDRKWRDPPPLSQAAILSTLGIAQFRLGKLDIAEATLTRCLASVETSPQRSHWLGLVLSNLSLIYQERGQYDRALPLLNRAVSEARTSAEAGSEPLAWALTNLANVYRILGDHAAALDAAQEAYGQFAATLGESNHQIVNAAVHVAGAKAMLGDPSSAIVVLEKAIVVQRELPPEHIERALVKHFLGLVLLRQGRLQEAREATSFALRIRRKVFPAPNWRIAETAGQLGEILARMGERESARELLTESANTFARIYGANSIRARAAAERLQQFFLQK